MSDLQRIKDEAHLINEPDHYWVIGEVERLQDENAKLQATLANIDAVTGGLDKHRLDRIAELEASVEGWKANYARYFDRVAELEAKCEKALSDLAWNMSKRAELEALLLRIEKERNTRIVELEKNNAWMEENEHRNEARIVEQEAIIEGLVVERKLITDDYTTLKALLLAIRGDAQAAHWHEDIDAALGGSREPT
jgi:chromosome segregation ATPase